MNNQPSPRNRQGDFLLVGRTLTGTFIVLLIVVARFLGWLQPLELFCFDLMLKLRLPEPTDERIFLIEIDETDIAEMGNPAKLPAQELLNLLDRVQQYKPTVIGLNILNDLIDDPEYFSQQLSLSPSRTKNVIYPEKFLPPFIYPLSGIDPENVGFVDIYPDRDFNIRRSILGSWDFQKRETFKFSFSLLLAKLYLEGKGYTLENGQIDPNAMRFGTIEIPVVYPNTGGYRNIDDGGIQVLVNYRAGKTPFNKIALRDLKQGKFNPSAIQNKIVIVGITDPNKRFTLTSPTFHLTEGIDGIDLQAQFASQIISAVLDNRPLITTWREWHENVFILIFCIPSIFILIYRKIPFLYSNSIPIFILLFVITVSYLLFSINSYWITLSPAILMIFFNFIAYLIFSKMEDENERKISEIENERKILEIENERKISEIENERKISEKHRKFIERTFDIFHSGPLQTISIILKKLRDNLYKSRYEIVQDLENLDREIRAIGNYFKEEAFEHSLYLKSRDKLDLNSKLHELFHQVYSKTLERNYPNFQTITLKVRSFDEIPEENIDIETKRELCRFLEEAIWNVGKHAYRARSLTVTGKYSQQKEIYTLKIEDNGICENKSEREGNGTKQARKLEKKLSGCFKRSCIKDRGTVCELQWKIRR